MCSSTSCGAFVLQSRGTSECLSLSPAGVAVLSSRGFSANVYVCVCLCTYVLGSAHEQYVCEQGLAPEAWLMQLRLSWQGRWLWWLPLSYSVTCDFDCGGRECDRIEHMHLKCQRIERPQWPLSSHRAGCNIDFSCLLLITEENSSLNVRNHEWQEIRGI